MSKRFHSKTPKADVAREMGWDERQYKRFLYITKQEVLPKLLSDGYWAKIAKPKPLVWDAIPLSVTEEMRKDVNEKLKNDNAEADLDVLEWRFRSILLRKSKEGSPSQRGDPPVANPPPQPAKSPGPATSSPANPPEPTRSRPSGFWDPVAAAQREE
ncbi:hypothetical protein GTA08_BOTSDO13086 [Botryosphaeria dothidea]|uniref:Uncharacterized protein n=1 Tax=Botryosphaeria dothidea TaxID=55169 RepID=A0A8H4J3Q3_9PEZI|nr:hypothetical protein GTA08_BOTSDO13086 [Botryosphaeria dothidea]